MITSQQRPENNGDAESQKDFLMHDRDGIMMTASVDVESVYNCSLGPESRGRKGPEIRVHETT